MKALEAWVRQLSERRMASHQVTAASLVMARRVGRAGERGFAVLLDVEFAHLGRHLQTTVPAAEFPTAAEAHTALARWPIGSRCRVRFHADRPETVWLV